MTPQIVKLNSCDIKYFTELIRLFEDVFEMKNLVMPSAIHLQKILSEETFLSFVAVHDNKIVGGLTCYILPAYYVTSSSVYVFDLAVLPAFQRKGIGRMLIESVKEYSKNLGYKEVFLQTEVEDQHAIDFYRATEGFEEQTVLFSYPFNK